MSAAHIIWLGLEAVTVSACAHNASSWAKSHSCYQVINLLYLKAGCWIKSCLWNLRDSVLVDNIFFSRINRHKECTWEKCIHWCRWHIAQLVMVRMIVLINHPSLGRWNVWSPKHDETAAARGWWFRKSHGVWWKVMRSAVDPNKQRHLKV